MADQLKEIYNADVYLNSFTGTSKSIITTDATTQYVIKDVQIGTNTIPGTEVLSVNGVTTTPNLTANLSGSEIVDVNSTVSVVLPAAPTYSKSSLSAMSNGYVAGSYFVDATNYVATIGASSSSTPVGPSYPALVTGFSTTRTPIDHWVINGDVYYWNFDSNSSWGFYKRTGGFNGTETLLKDSSNNGTITHNPGTYSEVLYSASANKFYMVGSNNVVVTYDPLTNTSTQVSIASGNGWPSLSTYARYTLSNNGLIFVVPHTGYTSNVWAINPATGHSINFQSLYDTNNYVGWGQSSKLFVHFTGTQYYIWRFTNDYLFYAITNASAVPTFPTSSSTYYSNYVNNALYVSSNVFNWAGGTNVWSLPTIYTSDNQSIQLVGTVSGTAPVIRTFSMINFSQTNTTVSGAILSQYGFKSMAATSTPTAGEIASITNYPQRIRLRITGVQTTL